MVSSARHFSQHCLSCCSSNFRLLDLKWCRGGPVVHLKAAPQKQCCHQTLSPQIKVHLTPKYNCTLNKSLYFVKLIGERIFRFGRIIDILSPVEVEEHLVQVRAKGSWGESSCDVERRTVYECLLVLFTVFTV